MGFNTLLRVGEMYEADRLTIQAGTPGIDLMENAGRAISEEIMQGWTARKVVILCGPGNNGGDGFVVARLLAEAGWPVRVYLLGETSALKGDAALAAGRWKGPVEAYSDDLLDGGPLVVDALFGAGLARPLEGDSLRLVNAINRQRLDCVGVDMPSGVQGDSGEVLGAAPQCALTVTFFRAKPGHLLTPGRDFLGRLVVADIGIDDAVLDQIKPHTRVNGPELWSTAFPKPATSAHKFARGHVLIAGGEMPGAALLAARGARRIGAGLVTLAARPDDRVIYASDQPGNIVRHVQSLADYQELCVDPRINTLIIGPGFGRGAEARVWARTALECGKPVVLDADGISSFQDNPAELIELLHHQCVITPHEGEFARVFDASGDKLNRALRAAEACGAVVLLKGPDTVVAQPSGLAVINRSGTPYLATAGSGDVLAGLIGGLLAQGMTPFDAAAAAAWMHGAAAEAFGPGLIAEDIPETMPKLISKLIIQ